MLKVNAVTVAQTKFPDGTPFIQLPPLASLDVDILWKFEDMSELFVLACLVKQYRAQDVRHKFTLFLPYLPNARQDRVKDAGRDVFTLKWFCEAINDLNFVEVKVFDVHSIVALALLNNVCSITSLNLIEKIVRLLGSVGVSDVMYFFPDTGAEKKYTDFLVGDSAFGIKHREWSTGRIKGLDVVGCVRGRNILIIDDICSKGGTLYRSVLKLKELGANKIWVYVSHCEDVILRGSLLDCKEIERIFTTDSILTVEHPLIDVIHTF